MLEVPAANFSAPPRTISYRLSFKVRDWLEMFEVI
jgi:hypothetical protein